MNHLEFNWIEKKFHSIARLKDPFVGLQAKLRGSHVGQYVKTFNKSKYRLLVSCLHSIQNELNCSENSNKIEKHSNNEKQSTGPN